MNLTKDRLIFFLFTVITLLAGVAAVMPLTVFHGAMAPGDHGFSYYVFDHALSGQKLYHDFQWIYGPVMPFYYGLSERVFGVDIAGILMGKALLVLASGIVVFLTLARLVSPLIGFAGALWFYAFIPDFYYTPNHAGGVLMVCLVALCLCRYCQRHIDDWLWRGLFAALVLFFIKPNFGATAIAILVFTAWAAGRENTGSRNLVRGLFYFTALIVLPGVTALGYLFLLRGLTLEEINQCLPYFIDAKAYTDPALPLIKDHLLRTWRHFIHSRLALASAAVLFGSIIYLSVRLRAFDPARRRQIVMLSGVLLLYAVFNLHEFFKSGIPHRIPWAQPTALVLMFYLIGEACRDAGLKIRLAVVGLMMLLACVAMIKGARQTAGSLNAEHYLDLRRASVYVTNDREWIRTVRDTVSYLNSHLKPGDLFFAAPFDPLLYYLTGRDTPSRMFLFFQFIDMSPEQEAKVIAELEQKKVNMIVLSNRVKSTETGLGEFGVTHNKILARYINENFMEEVRFGDWENEPGWDANLGYKILIRTGH